MDEGGPILKTDALARVKTPPERRQQLLDEFERSGLSGIKFAALVGVKYSTLAGWAAKRKRQGQTAAAAIRSGKSPPPVQWVEAVLDQAQSQSGQIGLAAALLQALEKAPPSC
jgi:hypothetical protein